MLYIPIRLIAAVISTAGLAIGGTVVSGADDQQPQASVVERSTVAAAPPQRSTVPQRELATVSPDQQRLTLGAGERLEAALQKTVRQMDARLTPDQVDAAVRTLTVGIQTEAPGVDLNNLKPGVSMVILRRQTASGIAAWDVYLGKYSGIEQEEG